MTKRQKMSKSRGNVIHPEEMVYGVCDLSEEYEFRDLNNEAIDHQRSWIYRKEGKHFYHKSLPVFLCRKNYPVPCLITINGEEQLQHEEQINYWLMMLEKYENPK